MMVQTSHLMCLNGRIHLRGPEVQEDFLDGVAFELSLEEYG